MACCGKSVCLLLPATCTARGRTTPPTPILWSARCRYRQQPRLAAATNRLLPATLLGVRELLRAAVVVLFQTCCLCGGMYWDCSCHDCDADCVGRMLHVVTCTCGFTATAAPTDCLRVADTIDAL